MEFEKLKQIIVEKTLQIMNNLKYYNSEPFVYMSQLSMTVAGKWKNLYPMATIVPYKQNQY